MADEPIQCRGCGLEFDGRFNYLCPHCKTTNAPRGYIHVGNRTFSGARQESIYEGCHPAEVPTMERIYAGSGGSWQKNGTVKFKSRSDYNAFQRRKMDLERKGRERQAIKDAKKAIAGKAVAA